MEKPLYCPSLPLLEEVSGDLVYGFPLNPFETGSLMEDRSKLSCLHSQEP